MATGVRVYIKTSPLFFTGQAILLTKLSPYFLLPSYFSIYTFNKTPPWREKEASQKGENLSHNVRENLSPKNEKKLCLIMIPDLGGKSHCGQRRASYHYRYTKKTEERYN